jgi:glucan biosynthesis protein
MEPIGNVQLPIAQKGDDNDLVIASELDKYREIDYDARSELISERLKLLLEMFMSRYDFQPVVYLDTVKQAQLVYWRFKPSLFEAFEANYRNDGIVSSISFPDSNVPNLFTVKSPKAVRSIVVVMAVAESALRRGILGLKFTRITAW